ncbi:MAG: tyrosine-type recombinase/integrase [Bacilli bacterium]|nr:tyrosine-type recombinase/integrase [Bacilli bacterium]
MKDIIYEFLDYISLEKKYSNHTETNYEIDLNKYEKFLNDIKKDYKKVKYEDISQYIIMLKKSGYKPASINRNLSTLRSFYNYLVLTKIISYNTFDLIKGMKEEKRLPNYFKYDEFILMLDSLKEDTPLNMRNRLILELLLATGIRVSELVNIKLSDISLKTKEIKIYGKGKKERIVFFGNYSAEVLDKYLSFARGKLLKNKISDYLFINNLGGKLTDRGVRGIIDKIIKTSGVKSKVSPHTFRHTFATIMLKEGCNIKSVGDLLGHSSLNTTSIYTHLTNEEVRRVYLNAHPRAKK